MKLYGVITMDVVKSRLIENRQDFQQKLINHLDTINSENSGLIVTPGTITLGDEWQIIINEPCKAYDLVYDFQRFLWEENAELYAGIGIGTLSTNVYEDIRRMDGTCFNLAREALILAKQGKTGKGSPITSKSCRVYLKSIPLVKMYKNPEVHLYTSEAAMDSIKDDMDDSFIKVVNALIENTEILKGKMTPKQKDTCSKYIKFGSYRKLIEAGGNMETIGAVSQKVNSAEFFTINHNHSLIASLIESYCRRGV